MKKSIKKALSLLLTVSATVGFMGGCSTETKTPEFQINLSYENKSYTLNYTLHRSVAPNTVKHFIKLVENDYYDGLCIHDYDKDADKMYAGGYTYENNALIYKNYYDVVKGYENFNHTVYKDLNKTEALYTLYGEFSKNSFKVGDDSNSGALKESFGAISMYYTEKGETDSVYVVKTSGETEKRDYNYNSATSLFSIAMKDFASVNDNYCTFATLNEGSVEVLEDLIALIETDEDITSEVEMDVDLDDEMLKDFENQETYDVLKTPLVITEIKITKY